jgi:hypothetical protein
MGNLACKNLFNFPIVVSVVINFLFLILLTTFFATVFVESTLDASLFLRIFLDPSEAIVSLLCSICVIPTKIKPT